MGHALHGVLADPRADAKCWEMKVLFCESRIEQTHDDARLHKQMRHRPSTIASHRELRKVCPDVKERRRL